MTSARSSDKQFICPHGYDLRHINCARCENPAFDAAHSSVPTGKHGTMTIGGTLTPGTKAIPTSKDQLDPSLLMDNAACASQCSELLDDHPTRQAVLLNVYRPLWDEIERLRAALERAQHQNTLLLGRAPETIARQTYMVTGRFLPLSQNGVLQVGLGDVIHETTHEVLIVDEHAQKASEPCPECVAVRKLGLNGCHKHFPAERTNQGDSGCIMPGDTL